MKYLRAGTGPLDFLSTIVFVLLLCSHPASHAQQQTTIELQLVDPTNVPPIGNFYSTQAPDAPPSPIFIFAGTGIKVDVYQLGAGFPPFSYLVDDAPLGPLDYSTLYNPIDPVTAARTILSQQLQPLQNNARLMTADDTISDPGGSPPADPPPTLLDPGSVPALGTFYFLVHSNYPPMPYNPCAGCSNCSVWLLSDGTLLVDDTYCSWPTNTNEIEGGSGGSAYSYPTGYLWLEIITVTNGAANVILHGTTPGTLYTITSQQDLNPSQPWSAEQTVIGGSGTNTPAQVLTFGRSRLFLWAHVGPDVPQRLWLLALGVTNTSFNCLLIGTVPGALYQIGSKTALDTNQQWASEAIITGTSNQFWTQFSIPISSRPSLFLSALNLTQDSDGNELPDWWELRYFGSIGLDPYSQCPSGDGWSLLQAYQNGWNPLLFYTPPPPRNLHATLDSTGSSIILTWESGGGPVSAYKIKLGNFGMDPSSFSIVGQVNASTFTFTNPVGPGLIGAELAQPELIVDAQFTSGDHAPSEPIGVYQPTLDLGLSFIRGRSGQPYVALASPPANLSRVLLFWETGPSTLASANVYASYFVNGVAPAPAMPGYNGGALNYQVISSSGFGEQFWTQPTFPEERYGSVAPTYQFIDARRHLKENLRFLVRAATRDLPFAYATSLYIDGGTAFGPPDGSEVSYPETYFSRPASPSTYEYSGFHTFSSNLNYSVMQELRPVQENYLWRNFVFDPLEVDSGYPTTGAYLDPSQWLRMLQNPTHTYAGLGTENPLPVALISTNSDWLFWYQFDSVYWDESIAAQVGVLSDPTGHLSVASSVLNAYGLPLLSLETGRYNVVLPTGSTGLWDSPYYADFAQPVWQTLDYYFASQTRYYKNTAWFSQQPLSGSPPPLPGSPTFAISNSPPLLISSIGQSITVSAWAKMSDTNNYQGRPAYLEQYFDKAYLMDSSANATTNDAGPLSPYGEFFPTTAGQVALVTMPDIDPPYQRATGVLSVMKLQLDVNHDGTMDLTFGGPDNTAWQKPFVFWVNNDCDWSTSSSDPGEDSPLAAEYPKIYADYITPFIRSQRDLEDWARLWICGVPALNNGGYQVTLSWTNVTSGSPAINLVNSIETNGGTLYLTDPALGAAQSSASTCAGLKYPTITTTNALMLPSSLFTNAGNKYFLLEGAGIGSGQLLMTITQNSTNVIAQTGAWFDLHDIHDFYEEADATNVPTGVPPSTLVSQFRLTKTTSGMPNETKQTIVFVHGINNTVFDYDNSSQTMFKRLYWAGYHGRFAAFRWPCAYLPPTVLNPFQYNKGEFYAWKAAAALKNYLGYLRNRPDLAGYSLNIYAHSQGNVVASEALAQGATFDNYILSQGAIPAHCYDTNAPFLQKLLDAETNSVNAKQTPFFPANGGYHGYFSAVQGNLVDLYNTNDFALASGVTSLDPLGLIPIQTNWEEDQRSQKPEAFLGGPSYLYDPSTFTSMAYYTFGSSYTVTDQHELKSMVARSRSKAVGAQDGLHGAIKGSVDLKALFGFGKTREEHSAQFTRPIQTVLPYYQQLLTSFQILP
jgi:hypothetical protein